jgi:hypothetical protein
VFQLKLGVTESPVAAFAGDTKVGAASGAVVVNDHTGEADSALLLLGSRLATLQKYVVPWLSAAAGVKGGPLLCVETVGGFVVPRYTEYPALPLTTFQLKLGVTEIPAAPFAGDTKVGAGSPVAVVNDRTSEGFSVLLLFGS